MEERRGGNRLARLCRRAGAIMLLLQGSKFRVHSVVSDQKAAGALAFT
jgi:hypothetical protein